MRLSTLRTVVNWAAIIICGLVAVLPPVIHAYDEHKETVNKMELKVAFNVGRVARHISLNSELWKYQDATLSSLIELPSIIRDINRTRIVDELGKVVLQQGPEIDWPVMTRSVPILVRDSQVGSIEIDKSMRPLLIETGYVAIFGILLGLAAYIAVRASMRALDGVVRDLNKRNRQFDAALNNMSQGLCMFDAAKRLVICNARYGQMYRLPPELQESGTPHDTIVAHRVLNGLLKGEKSDRAVQQRIAALAKLPADAKSARIDELADGRLICVTREPMEGGGWVATHDDITEKLRAEEERDQNRDFINQIIDNVPVAIIVKNASDRRIAYVNQATDRLWKLSRAETIGKTVFDFLPREQAVQITADDDSVLQTGVPRFRDSYQSSVAAMRGRTFVSRKLAIFSPDRKPRYVISVIEDVTERMNIESQLRQSQKMEAVGNLTGGVAHDFNNLLTVMIGNLDMLQDEIADRPAAAQEVEAILEAALRGAELTKQMLAYSRRQPLQPKCVDLNAIVDKTTKLLARTLGEGIRIDVRNAPHACPIMVDEAQLESALVNIAINARDAMPNGGALTIVTDMVLFTNEDAAHRPGLAAGEHVVVKISDTGTGMAAELIGRIFEPFFTTKETGKGSGLGLSMVYGFVKQSGGYVGVTSTLGEGTTFELCFPAAAKTVLAADAGTASNTAGHSQAQGEVVLAVDDQPEVRATAVAHLKSLGYQVLEADCAKSALDKFAAGARIDLLFTDIVMPGGLNGVELARLARAERPGLKVLYTSGYPGTGHGDRSEVKIDGALLAKPYRKQELAKAVADALAA
jgi:PAS domain S-box-containing protein